MDTLNQLERFSLSLILSSDDSNDSVVQSIESNTQRKKLRVVLWRYKNIGTTI